MKTQISGEANFVWRPVLGNLDIWENPGHLPFRDILRKMQNLSSVNDLVHVFESLYAWLHVIHLFWIRDVINFREEAGSADNESEVPGRGKRIISKCRCETQNTRKASSVIEEHAHNGSFKSNSNGAGGLFGDCQNKPKDKKGKKKIALFFVHLMLYICMLQ